MLFKKSKSHLQVDLGDLKDETERLASFLRDTLKAEVTASQNRLIVESEKASAEELQKVVNKFVYRQHLNGTHWVSLDGSVVKIKQFDKAKKVEKNKKQGTSPKFAHGF